MRLGDIAGFEDCIRLVTLAGTEQYVYEEWSLATLRSGWIQSLEIERDEIERDEIERVTTN